MSSWSPATFALQQEGHAAGDRLNFGLAAEQAKAEGYGVEVVIVGDDCALPHTGHTKRRGIAGVTLAIKA